MKRYLFLLLLISFSANAQENLRKFRFGLKATPVFSWIKEDFKQAPSDYKVEGGGLRFGFCWGPQAEWILNETFLISTGVDISYTSGKLKGRGSYTNTPAIFDWEQTYRLRFIDVPLMLKFRTREIGYLRYFGVFGLGAGFRTRAETVFSRTENNITNSVQEDEDSGKYIHPFRGSMLVGGGVEYNLSGNTSLVASIVFNNGLTNILKDQKDPNPFNPVNQIKEKGINNYFMLNIGILF